MSDYTLENMQDFAGKDFEPSEWVTVDQQAINGFADITRDPQWIHVDVDRCAKESPFGKPIAHGFLGLSLLAGAIQDSGLVPSGVKNVLNYGLNKVRFIAPVPVDSRLRVTSKLAKVEEKGSGKLCTIECAVEIDGSDKPALIAESLLLLQG